MRRFWWAVVLTSRLDLGRMLFDWEVPFKDRARKKRSCLPLLYA